MPHGSTIRAQEEASPTASEVSSPRGSKSFSQKEFGKYELLGEIGRGGMGVVYKARQVDLDRIVALKMIVSSHLASPEQVDRFRLEARRRRECDRRISSASTKSARSGGQALFRDGIHRRLEPVETDRFAVRSIPRLPRANHDRRQDGRPICMRKESSTAT